MSDHKSEAELRKKLEEMRKQMAMMQDKLQASEEAHAPVRTEDIAGNVAAELDPDSKSHKKVTVRALAGAYDKLGDAAYQHEKKEKERESKKPKETSAPAAKHADPNQAPTAAQDDDDELELDDDDLDLDDLDLDDLEDAAEETPAADGGGDDDDLDDLDLDDLDLDDDDLEGEPKAETGKADVTKSTAQNMDDLDMDDLDLDDDDDDDLELDDEDLDLDEEETNDDTTKTETTKKPEATAKAEAKVQKKEDQRQRSMTVANTAPNKGAEDKPKEKAIVAKGEDSIIAVPSHAMPNNRFFREPFRVIKVDEGALLGTKKERIWDVDFFGKQFSNLDMSGYKSFSHPASNLFRVERNISDTRRLVLYFFEAPHPYDLVLTSTERRNRFFELAMMQRRNSVMWCPSLCPDGETDAVITVKGTTIQRQSGKIAKANGENKFSVARMPYEIIDFWFGCFNMGGKSLPSNHSTISGFIPKTGHEIYIIGVSDLGPGLLGKPDLGIFFQTYLGPNFYVLSQTTLDSKEKSNKNSNAILVIVRRAFIVRIANIEAIEIDTKKKGDKEKSDFSAAACVIRVNESTIGCVLVNATATHIDPGARSANLRGLLSNISMGNASVDIGARFDYLFIGGALGYDGAWGENDALVAQKRAGNLLSDFVEGKPDASLQARASMNPVRILYWHRPSICRADVKKYYTSPTFNHNNAGVSCDVFTLRHFLSTFGETVPRCVFMLRGIALLGDRIPPFHDAELHIIAEWLEGAPLKIPMHKKGESYIVHDKDLPALQPCIHNFDFLRLQHVEFSIFGNLGPAPVAPVDDKKKKARIVIASGSLPFKNNFALAESKDFACPLYYRSCLVGTMCGSLRQEQDAALA